MRNEFKRHKKSDGIKWAIVFITVAALVVGFFAIVTKGFKQNDPKKWFTGEQVRIEVIAECGSAVAPSAN